MNDELEQSYIASLLFAWHDAKNHTINLFTSYGCMVNQHSNSLYEKIDKTRREYYVAVNEEKLSHEKYIAAKNARHNRLHNLALRMNSGEVNSSSKLVSFLYELMRDHLPPGKVEEIVRNSCQPEECYYTNGYLANYAKDIANRLEDGPTISADVEREK